MTEHVHKEASDSGSMSELQPKGFVAGFDLVFLNEARLAADRAAQAHLEERSARQVAGATAASVMCAAAAIEARLSEYVTYQENHNGLSEEAIKRIRDRKASPPERWKRLLSEVASGKFDAGSAEYATMDCLFDLRNVVAHRNARVLHFGEWPKHIKGCVQNKTIPVRVGPDLEWTSSTYLHPVAEWAYKTARSWLNLASELGVRIPES